jgi:uncharacterized protein (DUF302 family)
MQQFPSWFLKVLLGSILILPLTLLAHADDDNLVIKPSRHSVTETLDGLTAALTRAGIRVMARIDHAAGAKKVGKSLPPTELLIFGNPKLGTPLMMSKRTMGLDLPMKVLAWQDDKGKVWLAYTKPEVLKQRNGITDRDPLFAKMTKALNKLTDAASK